MIPKRFTPRLPLKTKTLSAADIRSYREDGFLVVRQLLDQKQLEKLWQATDEITRLAQKFREDTFSGATYYALIRDCNPFAKDLQKFAQIPGQLRRVTYPYAKHPSINQLRLTPKLLAVMTDLLGPDVVQIVNQINFSPPDVGGGWGWHQDYRFRKPGINNMEQNFVQCAIAMDPCHQQSGGLRIVPKSHKLGGLALDQNNEQAEEFFDASTAVTPELEPGDGLLFNPYVIHGSGPNKSSFIRRLFINGFANGKESRVGQPVVKGGKVIPHPTGNMEYEGDRELLPKASKY